MSESDNLRRALIKLSGSTFLGGLLLLACLPFIAQVYGPEEYGSYMILSLVVILYGSISMLRLDLAILSAKEPREAILLVTTCFTILINTTLIAGTLVWVADAFVPRKATRPSYTPVLIMLAVFFAGGFQILRNYSIFRRAYDRASIAVVSNTSMRTGAQISFGVAGGAASHLLIGEIIGYATACFFLSRNCRRNWVRLLRLTKHSNLIVSRHSRYILFGVPSALLDAIGMTMLLPLIAMTFSVLEAGLVGLTYRIFSAPTQIIAGNVSDLIHCELVALNRTRNHRNASYIRDWAAKLLIWSLPLGGLMLIFCFLASELILEQDWGRIILIAPFVMIHCTLAFIISPLSRILLIGDAYRGKLVYDFLAIIIPLGALLVASGRDLVTAIAVYTIGQCFCYALYVVIIWKCALRLDRTNDQKSANHN